MESILSKKQTNERNRTQTLQIHSLLPIVVKKTATKTLKLTKKAKWWWNRIMSNVKLLNSILWTDSPKKAVDMWWTADHRTQESFIFIYLDRNDSIRMVYSIYLQYTVFNINYVSVVLCIFNAQYLDIPFIWWFWDLINIMNVSYFRSISSLFTFFNFVVVGDVYHKTILSPLKCCMIDR